MAIRFGNMLFEPLWRCEWIDNIQISIAEELGVEERGEFYDRTGALRDMLQSHLLQLLCIVAMEPPASLSEDAVRDEKRSDERRVGKGCVSRCRSRCALKH